VKQPRGRTAAVFALLRSLAPDPRAASVALDRAQPLELAAYRTMATDSAKTAPSARTNRGRP